ncbi:MAG: FkbM family methyltransferase [Chloroflexota bacterium]
MLRRMLRDLCHTKVPGRYVAVEALSFAYTDRDEPLVRIGSRGKLSCDLRDQVQRQIYFGIYDEPETRLARRLCTPGSVCLDVGANVGYYTILMADAVGSSGMVHAFEPIPDLADRLERNAELSGLSQIRLNRAAVTTTSGELELFVRAGVTNSGWASVVPSPGHENVAVRVPAVTIDGYVAAEGLEQVRLVKMDIEGAEPGALAGGAQLFSRDDAPDVLCEVNPFLLDRAGSSAADLLQRFEGYGYRLFRIDRSGFTELHASTAESALMNVIATKAPARVLSA